MNDGKLWAAAAVIITDSVIYEALTADAGLETIEDCWGEYMFFDKQQQQQQQTTSIIVTAGGQSHSWLCQLTVHLIVDFLF